MSGKFHFRGIWAIAIVIFLINILGGGSIFEAIGGIVFAAILAVVISFLINKFKYNEASFYKIMFYLMFIPLLQSVVMIVAN